MKRRFFVRSPRTVPVFAQDHPTYFMVGRWCTMHVPHYGDWFVVIPAPTDPMLLNRPMTEMREITRQEMRDACGERLRLEEWQERLGFRFKPVALWITKRLRFLGRIKWLNRLAHLDDEDSPEWWMERQQPQIGVCFGPKEGVD